MTPTDPSPIPAEEILGKFTDERDGYFKLEYMQYEQMRVATEKLRRPPSTSPSLFGTMMLLPPP